MENITDVEYKHAKKYEKILFIIMVCMFKVIHYCLEMYLKVFVTTV